jgi:hypothetical protein
MRIEQDERGDARRGRAAGRALKLAAVAALLVGPPLLSVPAMPATWAELFAVPPTADYIESAPFSWLAFGLCVAFVAAWVLPAVLHAFRTRPRPSATSPRRCRFPWWGWCGVMLTAAAWAAAWTRPAWLGWFRGYTFFPLWAGYIVVVNALTCRRIGRCLMLSRPRFFLLLFPVSAAFWWFFEYLNRFVENWRYVEVGPDGALTNIAVGPWEYALRGTLAFSTVLAAVLSTRELLSSMPFIDRFRSFGRLRPARPRVLAAAILLVSAAGLAAIGAFPNYLFPLLWVAPMLLLAAVQTLWGERHVFSDAAGGDWRPVVSAALAALVCGFFWEMWNVYSSPKWIYDVPFVHRFEVFEMPLLGYAGYLPFGVECALVGDLLRGGRNDASALKHTA